MRFVRTSNFGALEEIRNGVPHSGNDYAMEIGTRIEAVGSGVIQKIVDYGDVNAGKTVIMQLDNGQQAVYGHLSQFLAKEGQRVSQGDPIALSGSSGFSSGPHLHFAIKDHGTFVDPSNYEPIIQQMGAGVPSIPSPEDAAWALVEKGRDAATGASFDLAKWMLEQLGHVLHDMGLWLIQVAPDALIALSMIFCLGAICSIPKTGKWTAAATAGAVIAEVIRRATFLA